VDTDRRCITIHSIRHKLFEFVLACMTDNFLVACSSKSTHCIMTSSFERRFPSIRSQWRRQDFVTGRGSEVWVYGRSIEYEDPQSRLYCLCINVALCSTALQCICPVIRRSSMTMKAHILHNFWTSTHRGEASSPSPWRRHCPKPSRHPDVVRTQWSSLSTTGLRMSTKIFFRQKLS